MGNVKNLVANETLPTRDHYYSRLWVDLCENLHIHLRNIRIDLSKDEFDELVLFLNSAKSEVDKFTDYKEQSGWQMMFRSPLRATDKDSDYYPNRFRVEDEHDGSVHIHYRDIRIHLTRDEYSQMFEAMKQIGE